MGFLHIRMFNAVLGAERVIKLVVGYSVREMLMMGVFALPLAEMFERLAGKIYLSQINIIIVS